MDSDSTQRPQWVLDNFPKTLSQLEALEQAEILPEIIFYLRDTNERGRSSFLLVFSDICLKFALMFTVWNIL